MVCVFLLELNPSAKDLVPFHSKQRAAVRANPLPGQHQALGLYLPYFWGSQCSILSPNVQQIAAEPMPQMSPEVPGGHKEQ